MNPAPVLGDLCRLRFPGRRGVFAYACFGHWFTLAEDGEIKVPGAPNQTPPGSILFLPAPIVRDDHRAAEFAFIEHAHGSAPVKVEIVSDEIERRVALALVTLAELAFPITIKERRAQFHPLRHKAIFAASCNDGSVAGWKVATCLFWPYWEAEKATIEARAATLTEQGFNVTAEQLKDALKRDSALKHLKKSKGK